MLNFKRTYFLVLFIALFATAAFATTPEGIWLARSPKFGDKPIGKVKITIHNGKLIGELIEVYPMNSAFDRFCWRRNVSQTQSGPVIMCDYAEQQGKWIHGKIYESSSGKVYKSELKLSDDGNRLYVGAFAGVFSATVVWDRLSR